MVTNITTVETGNEYWVNVSVDDGELPRRGPYDSADEAAVVAAQLGAIRRRGLRQQVHASARLVEFDMGEDELQDKLAHLADDLEFISDLCQFSENILTEKQVKKKWKFDDATWEKLGSDDRLIEAVELEKTRRIRTGQQKRERAQVLVTKAPDVVSAIMLDDSANARHRIDASKTLNEFASNGPGQTAPAADRFIIQIDWAPIPHTEHYNKSIKPDADDVDPFNIDTGVIAAIAKKPTESGGGNTL